MEWLSADRPFLERARARHFDPTSKSVASAASSGLSIPRLRQTTYVSVDADSRQKDSSCTDNALASLN
jgi:hypothetical protein